MSLNFLGSLLTSPLSVRRAELRSQYGFTCGCSRCAAEARHTGTPLAALVERTYEACQRLAPELDAAIERGDSVAVAGAREQLVGMQVRGTAWWSEVTGAYGCVMQVLRLQLPPPAKND